MDIVLIYQLIFRAKNKIHIWQLEMRIAIYVYGVA